MSSPLLFSQTNRSYYFKSQSGSGSILKINLDGPSLTQKEEYFPSYGVKPVSGILGIIRLRLGKYLILATKSKEIGRLKNHAIHKVIEYTCLPLHNPQTIHDKLIEEEHLKLLKQHLDQAPLYFSYTFDVTNSLQRNKRSGNSWKFADDKFFWNRFILSDLIERSQLESLINDFILPVIYGFVGISNLSLNGHNITFAIISRRSKYRAGTRYFRRGIDYNGNVANFNETEQMLIINNSHNNINNDYEVKSFVQTRGSVPIYWAEINNLKYKPHLKISSASPGEAARKHFTEQINTYGKNYLVNLVDNKGHELPVKEAYEQAVQNLDLTESGKLAYIYFNFHNECRKMKWNNVYKLLDTLRGLGFTTSDYYHEISSQNSTNVQVLRTQETIVRTNCMDCLDRTNVVQGTLARVVLSTQLSESGVIPIDDDISKYSPIESIFRNEWADNGNSVSLAYSGTGALKTDFTRTGKRTILGGLNDLLNSISRYWKNNFKDDIRQDGFDLILGNYLPFEHNSPFEDSRPIITRSMPYITLLSVILFLSVSIYPNPTLPTKANSFIKIGCLFAFFNSLFYITKNGLQYVSWPKFCELDFLYKNDSQTGLFTGLKFTENPVFEKYLDEKKRSE